MSANVGNFERADARDLPFQTDLTQRASCKDCIAAKIVDLVVAVVTVAHDQVGGGAGEHRWWRYRENADVGITVLVG